jgi:flagellin-like hook-associated protein FlgL
MAADITLSAAVRNNLLALQNTAQLLGRTQERLATGLKVNSALDDPTAFFTASSLNSRASDLNRLLDSVGNALQTIRAADNGIEALTNLVETAQAAARQALQSPGIANASVTGTGAAVAADTAATVTNTTATLNADVNASEVGTGTFDTSAAGGSFTVNGFTVNFLQNDTIGVVTTNIQAVLDANNVNATASNNGTVITIAADDADTTITLGGANLAAVGLDTTTSTANVNLITQSAVAQGETLTFTVGSGSTQTITFGTGALEVSTLAELSTALGNLTGFTSATVNAANGNISFTALSSADDVVVDGTADITNFGFATNTTLTFEPANATIGALTASSTLTVQVGSNTTTTVTFGTGANVGNLRDLNAALAGLAGGSASVDSAGNLSVTANNNTDSITIGGTTTLATFGVTAGVTAPANNADRAALEAQFNDLRTQIDQLAGDTSFNGVNLLGGDNLSVIFNEDNTSSLAITGVTFNSAGLGISAAATDSFQNNANVNARLTELDAAIRTLRQQARTFGSNLSVVEIRQDFTKKLINTLETGAANLTLADANEEGANVLALETRQQLSSVALSLASQADQNVLRLF